MCVIARIGMLDSSRSSICEIVDGASNCGSVLYHDSYILTLLPGQRTCQAIDQNVPELVDARQRVPQIVGQLGAQVVPLRDLADPCLYLSA